MRKPVKSAEVLAELHKQGRLPVIPDTLREFELAWRDPHKHMTELGAIVANNPDISKRIINTANSVLHRGDTNVDNAAQAVARLGVIETRNVVHAVSLHDAFNSPYVDPKKFWRHSISSAFAARKIAEYMNKRFKWEVDPQMAFLAALVHEAGLVLMTRFFKSDYGAVRDASRNLDEFLELESKTLHMTHAVLGAALFQQWHLPTEIVMGVAGHHHPARLHQDHYRIAYVTCLAEGAAWLLGEGNGFFPHNPEQTSVQLIQNLERERLTRDHLLFLAKQAREDSESSSMLGMF
jgi:HD-like signal output (HDOD) protein